MDRISNLKPDNDYEKLYKFEKEKVLMLQNETLKLKSHIKYLEEELLIEKGVRACHEKHLSDALYGEVKP